jgi:hypothetical protein
VRWRKKPAATALCSPISISPNGDGRFARLFRMLVKVDLLVLDGDLIASPLANGAISWRSSRIAMAVGPS